MTSRSDTPMGESLEVVQANRIANKVKELDSPLSSILSPEETLNIDTTITSHLAWLKQQVLSGQIKLPDNLLHAFSTDHSQNKKLDLNLTDSVLGRNFVTHHSPELTDLDHKFFLECFQKFISDSGALDLSLGDLRDLLKLLARKDEPVPSSLFAEPLLFTKAFGKMQE